MDSADSMMAFGMALIVLVIVGLIVQATYPRLLIGFGTASLSGADPASIAVWGVLGLVFLTALIFGVFGLIRASSHR